MPREKKRTEVFVCDFCGLRQRLARDQRHWCTNCNETPPVEMRLTRGRLHHQRRLAEPAPKPTEAPRFDPISR
jgi:hypothetical protein